MEHSGVHNFVSLSQGDMRFSLGSDEESGEKIEIEISRPVDAAYEAII